MNLLITGSHGQLGNELTSLLTAMKGPLGDVPAEYEDASVTAVDVEELDITNTEHVFEFVSTVQPDVIINCAAMTNVDACETQLETAMRVNAIGPRNLAMAAEEFGAKFIHVSTDYVFRGDASVPYCEWDVTGPNTGYGKSKLLGEKYAADFSTRYFIIRTSWLYGCVGGNFVKTMLRLGAEKEEITVVADQRGNPTNAADLAYHILKLALTEEYGVYHCTGEGECSWYDFACEIMRFAGYNCRVKPCTTEEYPSPTPRPAFSSLNNLMLKVTVGNEMRQWKPALADYINQLKKTEA